MRPPGLGLPHGHHITYRCRKSWPGFDIPGALLPIQTSPGLVVAPHHSSTARRQMKALRNAFIPLAALRAFNFQSGARSSLNPSDALPAFPPGCLSPARVFLVPAWYPCPGRAALGGTATLASSQLTAQSQRPACFAMALTWCLFGCLFVNGASLQSAHPSALPPFVVSLLQL